MIRRATTGMLVFFVLLAIAVVFPPTGTAESAPQSPSAASSSAESIVAGLSDEQVRDMLISELRARSMEQEYDQEQQMVGPASIFNRLLRKFTGEHDENEEEFRKLWDGIPNIVPDLRKVFLTL